MKEHSIFREVTVRMCGTLNLEKALKGSFDYLKELIPLDELRVNILDTELQAIKTIATADAQGAKEMLEAPQILPISRELAEELKGTALADVRITGTIEEDRATSEVVSRLSMSVPQSSLLIMRLTLDGRRQGALVFRAEGQNRYIEEHALLITQLNEPFAIALNNALAHHEVSRLRDLLADDNRYLNRELQRVKGEEIVGADFGLSQVMEMVSSVAPLDSPVLLMGETGVGKELVANAIHHTSRRQGGPFIKLNCGTIPSSLLDSELFGHEKGAFTGAVSQRRGRFERADGGTLFLDEIGELPPEAQVKLLRVLQFKELERVGGTRTIPVDVRVIVATHRELPDMVHKGTFREDLWYRINVFPIIIPPLRQRKADIPALLHHFLRKKSAELGLYPVPALTEEAVGRLMAYHWPGNVRELENVVERALILSRGRPLSFEEVGGLEKPPATPTETRTPEAPVPLDRVVADHIRRVLMYTEGKVAGPNGAAMLLGVNQSTLRNRMKKLGIAYGRKTQCGVEPSSDSGSGVTGPGKR